MNCAVKYRLKLLGGFLLKFALLVAPIPLLLPIAVDVFNDRGKVIRTVGMFVTFTATFFYIGYIIDRYQRFRRRFIAVPTAAHDWQREAALEGGHEPQRWVCRRCGRQRTGEEDGHPPTDQSP